MPPIAGMMHWHSLIARHAKDLKAAFGRGLRALDAAVTGQPRARLEPALVRNTPKHPLHPLARIRQSQSRWFSTSRRTPDAVRNFTSSSNGSRSGVKFDRSSLPKSTIGSYVQNSTGRAPFASTLRPNLTGGTLGRTAGGYTTGSGRAGGARYFSHGPATQAQVVQNVSQAVRAFFISGQKAQFAGTSPFSGEKRFVAVSSLQEEAGRKMRSLPKATPGSWIDFEINPTITALTSLNAVTGYTTPNASCQPCTHINSEGLIDALSVDFSRALKDLAAVHSDLKRLSDLGDLLITYQGTSLRVHFPGCDSDTVHRLCEELGVHRGIICQDESFDSFVGADIALLFPIAPGTTASSVDDYAGGEFFEKSTQRYVIDLEDMMTPPLSDHYSTESEHDFEDVLAEDDSSLSEIRSAHSRGTFVTDSHSPLEYQGFEGIYRFIEELDNVRRSR